MDEFISASAAPDKVVVWQGFYARVVETGPWVFFTQYSPDGGKSGWFDVPVGKPEPLGNMVISLGKGVISLFSPRHEWTFKSVKVFLTATGEAVIQYSRDGGKTWGPIPFGDAAALVDMVSYLSYGIYYFTHNPTAG